MPDKLIVGLGNPGDRYMGTRHNVGFAALDLYHRLLHIPWRTDKKMFAVCEKIDLPDVKKFITIKPQTFYNESGKSVKKYANFYKIPPEKILIICDDFNLDFGKVRLRERGSAGGNNGLKSVISELGTENFPRIRIGTKNDELRKEIGDMDFVLSNFTPAECESLPYIFRDTLEKLSQFLET